MFSFEITQLGNLFFILNIIVFATTFFMVKMKNIPLYIVVFLSLSGVFYADSFLTLFIFWEIMTWSSFFIIKQTSSLKTTQKYIVFNLASGFAILFAIVLIYSFTGSFEYSLVDFSKIPQNILYMISVLVFIAVFIKSGILPFHHWIVDTYKQSNDIFSSVLSAIISKAGVFLFILFFYRFEEFGFDFVFYMVAILGVVTSIVSTFKAISQDNLKSLLAYSSIAQLGYIITVLALLNEQALQSGLYYIIIHTLTKLLLFINIAAIIYATSIDKFSNLGALIYKYQYNFILLVVGIIALAAMPPVGGFSGKFLIYTTLLESEKLLLLIAVMFSSASAFLYCYKLVYGIYLGSESLSKGKKEYKKIPFYYYISQTIAALILITLGVFPAIIVPYLNDILVSFNLNALLFENIYTLDTTFGSFNGAVVMGGFGVLFVIILALFLKGKTNNIKDTKDISYCGEIPNKDVNLHYGYGMGKELIRIRFIKIILLNSSKKFWDNIQDISSDISNSFKKLYTLGVQNVVLLTILFFTSLLFAGVYRW
ncbi:MAG: proton-conducting transporter membrane subunit [Campylobacterota bacterium]|nr:proton-conducting transporter membrane subunit [Campylobacterota bacterium]